MTKRESSKGSTDKERSYTNRGGSSYSAPTLFLHNDDRHFDIYYAMHGTERVTTRGREATFNAVNYLKSEGKWRKTSEANLRTLKREIESGRLSKIKHAGKAELERLVNFNLDSEVLPSRKPQLEEEPYVPPFEVDDSPPSTRGKPQKKGEYTIESNLFVEMYGAEFLDNPKRILPKADYRSQPRLNESRQTVREWLSKNDEDLKSSLDDIHDDLLFDIFEKREEATSQPASAIATSGESLSPTGEWGYRFGAGMERGDEPSPTPDDLNYRSFMEDGLWYQGSNAEPFDFSKLAPTEPVNRYRNRNAELKQARSRTREAKAERKHKKRMEREKLKAEGKLWYQENSNLSNRIRRIGNGITGVMNRKIGPMYVWQWAIPAAAVAHAGATLIQYLSTSGPDIALNVQGSGNAFSASGSVYDDSGLEHFDTHVRDMTSGTNVGGGAILHDKNGVSIREIDGGQVDINAVLGAQRNPSHSYRVGVESENRFDRWYNYWPEIFGGKKSSHTYEIFGDPSTSTDGSSGAGSNPPGGTPTPTTPPAPTTSAPPAPITSSEDARLYDGTPDLDRDGMDDEWEKFYGLNTNADDSGIDSDQDGYNNGSEYRNRNNPIDPNSPTKPRPIPPTTSPSSTTSSSGGRSGGSA